MLGEKNAMANISEQTRKQRESFSNSTQLGKNETAYLLFNSASIVNNNVYIDGEPINERAAGTLKDLYTEGFANDDYNPDFSLGHDGGQYSYSGTLTMRNDVNNQSDKPNSLGPNLKVPNITDTGAPSTEEANTTIAPPVDIRNRGFGVTLERNTEETFANYLARRDNENSNVKLGEFVDNDQYTWDND